MLIPTQTINFKKFCEYHNHERNKAKSEKDLLNDLVHKYAGNSGYGKFATDPEKFYDWAICEKGINLKEFEGGEDYTYYNDIGIDGNISLWRKKANDDIKNNGYYDVATAASITSFVRAMLWIALCQVKNPRYCDTDSILCDDIGKLKINEKLGNWKIEMFVKESYILAKKLYLMIGHKNDKPIEKLASKGANLKKEHILEIYDKGIYHWKNIAPTFSIFRGPVFIDRKIKKC